MDTKFQEAEGFGEEASGKKKSKFKSIKKFFGKRKRKETLTPSGSGNINTCQSAIDISATPSRHIDYDSEDDLKMHRTIMGNRALSHDSIFISETPQESPRPVRVFSQENVSDRIRSLQVKLQQNWKMGLSYPFGMPSKKQEDAGMSSEDDGLPRSPPETYLLQEILNPNTPKFSDSHKHHSALSLTGTGSEEEEQVTKSPSRSCSTESQLFSHQPKATIITEQTFDSSCLPAADFDILPELSSCLDNSAAKHKLSIKPRNQRSSKIRRLPLKKLSESQNDMICTLEEDESVEKEVPVKESYKGVTSSPQELTDNAALVFSEFQPLSHPDEKTYMSCSTSLMDSCCCESSSEGGESSTSDPRENTVLQHDKEYCETLEMSPKNLSNVPLCILNQENKQISAIPSKSDTRTAKNIPAKNYMTAESDSSEKKPLKDAKETLESLSNKEAMKRTSLLANPIISLSTNPSQLPNLLHSENSSISRASCRNSSLEERTSLTQGKTKTTQEKLESNDEDHFPAVSDGILGGKTEKETNDLCGLRKFSVSSARWRSRSNSLNTKDASEHEKPLAMQVNFSTNGEKTKKDVEMNSSKEKNRCFNKQKSSLESESDIPGRALDSKTFVSQPLGSKPVLSSSFGNLLQLSSPSHSSSESQNPFQVKLRSTSLSLKYRDIGQESKEQKGNNAELNLVKEEVTLSSLKVEKGETRKTMDGNVTDLSNESFKTKLKSSEQGNTKPPLPRKPALQHSSIISLNTSAEKQEKITKYPELKTESRNVEKKQNPTEVPETSVSSPVTATDYGRTTEMPAWISIAKQKQRIVEQEFSKEEKPEGQDKADAEKQIKEKETMEEAVRQQSDLPQNTVSSSPFTASSVETKKETKETKLEMQDLSLRNSLSSHQNPAQPLLPIEKGDIKPFKKVSQSPDQPSWMELAKKKSQAWSDRPQKIK
ncbi:CRACD-like protein [Ahaetulla prasina]|uniref:CRACD-like protein n=1 Tax=Ahaetulla prasina TaxID=499056 RepID=UPI0026475041|nr:CRACD-like protein [Ahaetulla prasina]XP_058040891.1 CRACD-like protein [Ahaetulla prasina]XP_058040892.1 CRACD-like protein [Ahaetulla prasina]